MEKSIDISRHQTAFDASKCKSTGVNTVLCRLAYGASKDVKLDAYGKSVKDSGMLLGGYGFGTWHYQSVNGGSIDKAREVMRAQISAWISYAQAVRCDSWVGIDQELESGQKMGLEIGANTVLLMEAATMIKDAGLCPCLYASASWVKGYVNLAQFTYPLWIAYYKWYGTTKSFENAPEEFPANIGTYGMWMHQHKAQICMWQFTSEGYADTYGCVHGSNGLDKNWLYYQPNNETIKSIREEITIAVSQTRLANGDVCFMWPVSNHRITAGWYYKGGEHHGALDFGVPSGTPVFAAEEGTVDYAYTWNGRVTKGDTNSYGNFIRIKHPDYKGKALRTLYAHLNTLLVKNGEHVTTGQLIGFSGYTGNCQGEHLHFEVQYGGTGSTYRCNPLNWLDGDFYKAYDYVRLGTYKSVERSGNIMQEQNASNAGVTYFKQCTAGTDSIIAVLQGMGENSSYDYRCEIAAANGITEYRGTAEQNLTMVGLARQGKLIKPDVKYFAKYKGTSGSIVTALNTIGEKSMYYYRVAIAEKNGIVGYKGTAAQNTVMLELLKKGTLKKP